MKKEQEWKSQEIKLLLRLYPYYDNNWIHENALPNHSVNGIQHKANRLNIHKTKETLRRILAENTKEFQKTNYIGRTNSSGGYVYLTYRGGKKIFEHRAIMEKILGRKLLSNEVVHHKNGDKTDNRPENLELLTNGEHTILHHKGHAQSLKTRRKMSDKAKERFRDPTNHPSWKGGRRLNHNGYYEIRLPNHPRARKNGYVFEHILIAEKMLGRSIENDEVVIHLNGIRDDDNPKNLKVIKRKDMKDFKPRSKSGAYFICPVCGKEFYVKPSQMSIRKTCSLKCAGVLFSQYYTGTPRDQKIDEEEKERVLCSIK